MTGWQEWLRLFIALVIIIGFFDMLLPANDIKKLGKLVAGLVLMLAVLQPVLAVVNLNWVNHADYYVSLTPQKELGGDWQRDAERLSEAGLRPVLRVVEDSAKNQLEHLITNKSWVKEVDVRITLTNNGEIGTVNISATEINEAQVSQQSAERVAELTKLVVDYLQIPESRIQITLKYRQEEMDYVR